MIKTSRKMGLHFNIGSQTKNDVTRLLERASQVSVVASGARRNRGEKKPASAIPADSADALSARNIVASFGLHPRCPYGVTKLKQAFSA